jgi:hypothetical protein
MIQVRHAAVDLGAVSEVVSGSMSVVRVSDRSLKVQPMGVSAQHERVTGRDGTRLARDRREA